MSYKKSMMHDILSERHILKHENVSLHSNLHDHFRLIATNRFKWNGLPVGIESYKIESFLYDHGQVAFFDDNKNGLLCLPCDTGGNLNIYGEPVELVVHGTGYKEVVKMDQLIRIKSNDLNKPLKTYVDYYVDLLFEIERIKFQNLRQQRFPFIIPCNKNSELTLKKMFENMEEGEEAFFVDEKLNMSDSASIQVLQTKAPYLLDMLQDYKISIMNELYTLLGVNNTSIEKKERLVVSEVNVNNQQILMNLELEYKHRLKASEEINKKFGLNITVEKTIEEFNNMLGGGDLGEIHARDKGIIK